MSLASVAARLPWPVFACDGDKKPLVKWRDECTTDPAEIDRQFDTPAAQMIGVPTGRASGLVVIDVDVKNGARGQEWLDYNQDALPETRTHRTRSGGLHLVFQIPEGVEIRNSAGRVAPGVDVRGEGGYVVVPPSPGYAVADDHEPAEMPRWLIRACLPPETQRTPVAPSEARHERYTQAAIDAEVLAVSRAPEGQRNDTLHRAAVKLGTLVGAGQMSRSTAEAELTRAGQAAGLPYREIVATVKSGLDFGEANPREMPQKQERGFYQNPPPDLPDDPGWWESLERSIDPPEPAETQDDDAVPPLEDGGVIDPRHWTAPAPLREWLVPDWIPIGYVTGIYGDGGLGKSLLAQQLLTAVATGKPWLGMEARRGPAFGFMCEDDHDELHRRQESINRGLHLNMNDLGDLRYVSRVGFDNLLMTFSDRNQGELTPLFREIVQYLRVMKPALVVIDTVADTFGGDEVKRAHARQFVQGVGGNIARAFNCAVVMLAHPSVAGISTGSGTGGSTAWSNTFRSRLYLTAGKDEADPDTRGLARMKANYAPKNADLKLRWMDGMFAPDGAGETPKAGQAPISAEDVRAIFVEIKRGWANDEPWSCAPQTKKFGRYLPLWMSIHFGMSERDASRMVEAWLARGWLRDTLKDAKTKTRGLMVTTLAQP